MTKFTVKQKVNRYVITCKNHAISDVCRGVSALIYALVNKLKFDGEEGKTKELDIKLESGNVQIKVEYKKDNLFEGKAVLETILLGMKAISEGYPEELEVSFEARWK